MITGDKINQMIDWYFDCKWFGYGLAVVLVIVIGLAIHG